MKKPETESTKLPLGDESLSQAIQKQYFLLYFPLVIYTLFPLCCTTESLLTFSICPSLPFLPL